MDRSSGLDCCLGYDAPWCFQGLKDKGDPAWGTPAFTSLLHWMALVQGGAISAGSSGTCVEGCRLGVEGCKSLPVAGLSI